MESNASTASTGPYTLGRENLFVGGRLSLDFINTSCERRGVVLEFLHDPAALRRWLVWAEEKTGIDLLTSEEKWSEELGEVMLSRAIELRAALRDLALSAVNNLPVPEAAIETVNKALQARPACRQIVATLGGLQEITVTDGSDERWLTQIANDAIDLLCHSDPAYLRQCACPTCVRVFYDTTKNHKRRWCVQKCGSAPKAAAYYRRKVARTKADLL
jgi:predicted RNA-binding Zn ribbon-like protein